MRGGKEYVKLQSLCKPLPEKTRMFSKLTLNPGASIGYHRHEGETELMYVLERHGCVQDDDSFYDVEEGDCTMTASGHSHSIENTGGSTLVLLAVIIRD